MQGPEDASGQSPEPVPFQPVQADPWLQSGGTSRHRRSRILERAIGIALGLVLGVAVVTAFVFLGSEETIDAPRIAGVETQPRPGLPLPEPEPERLPVVKVIGGAPPPSGPVRLDFKRGERIRFRVSSDAPVGLEIPGYGFSRTVDSGTVVSFRATKPGEFPVIVSASNIGVASLRVSR